MSTSDRNNERCSEWQQMILFELNLKVLCSPKIQNSLFKIHLLKKKTAFKILTCRESLT